MRLIYLSGSQWDRSWSLRRSIVLAFAQSRFNCSGTMSLQLRGGWGGANSETFLSVGGLSFLTVRAGVTLQRRGTLAKGSRLKSSFGTKHASYHASHPVEV